MDCSTSDVVVTVTGFRETFPEFVNDVAYPAYMIEPLLTLNKQLVNQARFGDLTAYMIYLRTAHMLVIQKQNMNAAARGSVPGMSVGPMSSKGAEGMSASYEVGAIMEDGDDYNVGYDIPEPGDMLLGPGPSGPHFKVSVSCIMAKNQTAYALTLRERDRIARDARRQDRFARPADADRPFADLRVAVAAEVAFPFDAAIERCIRHLQARCFNAQRTLVFVELRFRMQAGERNGQRVDAGRINAQRARDGRRRYAEAEGGDANDHGI